MKSTLNRIHTVPARLMLATLVLAAASALTVSNAFAAPDGPHGGPMGAMGMMGGGPMMGRGGPMGHMLDAVNATADQRTQIKAIMDAARTELKPVHDTMKSLHDQSAALFTQPTVDARAAEALRAQISAQREVVSKRMLQAMLDASRVLSPEQRAKLAEMRTKMGHHRGQ